MTLSVTLLFESDPSAHVSAVMPAGVAKVELAPVDRAALDAAAAGAWYWPEASESLAKVQGALRLHASPELSPRMALLALTRAAASLSVSLDPSAVLSEPVGLAFAAEAWREQSVDISPEDLPVLLWVAFVGTEREADRDLMTRGLAELALPEVEILQSKRGGEEVLEILMDLALVVLTTEATIEDGTVIEVSGGPIRVRRMPSARGSGASTLRARV